MFSGELFILIKLFKYQTSVDTSVINHCRCLLWHPELSRQWNIIVTYILFSAICQKCAGFKSSYTCGCGLSYNDHAMIVETREEREARGHPVGHDVGYKAMGGLTGFSSLAEGYARLDPSGRGKINKKLALYEN